MKRNRTRIKLAVAATAALLFLLLIVLVRCVDVAPIAAGGTEIGLSHLNRAVFDAVGVHEFWYKWTDAIGIVALLVGLRYALMGLVQWIRRKHLLQVDGEILALGVLYVTIGVLYVLFRIVTVNCRPILMPGATAPEASFPSSHTMLAAVIFGSVPILERRYAKKRRDAVPGTVIALFWATLTVVGRLLSGVHWFTDILGAILLSTALLSAYSAALDMIKTRRM